MTGAGPLHLEDDFFGADEALTNHAPGRNEWVATVMVSGGDLPSAQARRDQVIAEIRDRLGVDHYIDARPDEQSGRMR